MAGYCTSCFRDTVGNVRVCPRCAGSATPSSISIVTVVVAALLVLGGVLTLDLRLCAAGAVIGLVSIARVVWMHVHA
jgi:hypothetical protein